MYTKNSILTTAYSCAAKIFLAERYDKPFKHVVIDDFLPGDMFEKCLADFPYPGWCPMIWEKEHDSVENKYRTKFTSEFDFPGELNDVARILNSSILLKAMSEKMGIPKLTPDPYFTGGGLNYMDTLGKLDVHVDGNYHEATGLNRRLNAILFLKGEGDLGLFNKTGSKLVKAVSPIRNRLVIFDTHDKSFHGVIQPTRDRASLILYYYTVAPREHVTIKEPHRALWRKNNVTDKKGNKTI